MCEQPKIHVFLGAPPPSSIPASEPAAWVEGEGLLPASWRHLELTWREGRLRPAAGESGIEAGLSQGDDEDEVPDLSEKTLYIQQAVTNSAADWTNKSEQGQTNRVGKSVSSEKKDVNSGEEFDADVEDQCSALVHEYLDSCFPAAQPEPEPQSGSGSKQPLPPTLPPSSTRTHYLSTWTLSQALILKGRRVIQSAASPEKTPPKHTQTPPSASSSTPELFSPPTPSPGASIELFRHPSPTPRVEEGGVVLEATTDGVLCSQKSTTDCDSPLKSPNSKRVRLSEESRVAEPTIIRSSKPQSPTTPLSRCNTAGQRCSILVVVVHPCHLKEIKVKSGKSAGSFIPLASMVVTDQSAVEMKVVLWRRAAFWALTVSPGDILLITGLQVTEDRWRGETVLQSTFSSKLLNLGHASISPRVSRDVDARSLSILCGFVRERRPLLFSLPHHPLQDLNRLPYATLRSLQVNTLVHALLRVTHTHISSEWRSEAASLSRSALQLKAVLTVEQPDDQQGALLLWGAALDWLPCFKKDRATVWDFHFLLVRDGFTSDLRELHSTPWSFVRALDPTDRRVLDFNRTQRYQKDDSSPVELDVDTLLSQKYSGKVELRVQVFTFHFQNAPPSQTLPVSVLDGSTPPDGIVAVLNGDITYTGCGRCAAELDTDTNGIYSPCYPCLPHTTVRRYYRPGVLTASGQGCRYLSVQVPPVPLQKILDVPPDKLHRGSASGSKVKLIQVAAERLRSLLSPPRKTFIITIQSHFLCDENSIPIIQDFTLLDLQFPS